jgi:hypothetical protein
MLTYTCNLWLLNWRSVQQILKYCQSQSQSYITTDGQSASLSWCQPPIWDPRPIFLLHSLIISGQLRVCWYGAPSLTRGRACSFQLLLGLASGVFLGRESRRTNDHILLSRYRDSPSTEDHWNAAKIKIKLYCDRRSVGQFVLVSGPLVVPMTRFYISLSDSPFFLLHVGRSLWWEDGSVICSAMTQVQVKLYCDRRSIGQFVLLSGPLCGPWPDFNFHSSTITFFLLHVGRSHPYPPWTGWSSPKSKSKVKVTLVQGEICNVTIGKAAWEACSGTWNLGTNSSLALVPRKTTENLDRVGRSQDLPDANWLLAISPASSPNTIPYLCCFFLFYFFSFLFSFIFSPQVFLQLFLCA